MFSMPLELGEDRGEHSRKFESRSVKTRDAIGRNMFHFFYKIIICRLNKKKDDVRSAYVYFNFFHDIVNYSQPYLLTHKM